MTDGQEMVLVLTTAPDAAVAGTLVQGLVEERLAACGNIVPGLTSIYRWEGAVAREDEVLVILKTVRGRVGELFQRLGERHPYELPEMVTVSVDEVSQAYCRWVRQETIEVRA